MGSNLGPLTVGSDRFVYFTHTVNVVSLSLFRYEFLSSVGVGGD